MDFRKVCFSLLENKDYGTHIKNCFSKIAFLVYEEIYLYLWLICLYNIFLLMILLLNLFILLKIWKHYITDK